MSELPKEFARLAFENCSLLKATIELTTLCNFKCGHCYNFDRRPEAKQSGERGLTTTEVKRVIQELSDLGVLEITFSGGEATLRPDLPELFQFASDKRIAVILKTNGALLDARRVKAYVSAGLSEVDVTLYGFSPESHDGFTGTKGTFLKVVDNLKHIRSHYTELKVNLGAAILRHNVDENDARIELQMELGVPIKGNFVCHGRNDLDQSSHQFAVPLEVQAQKLPVSAREQKRMEQYSQGDASIFRCGCARTSLAVMANGDIVPCIEAPWVAGNVRASSLHAVWADSAVFETIRGLESSDWKTCDGCNFTQVCGRRNCSAYKYEGLYTGPDVNAAKLIHKRFHHMIEGKPKCLQPSEMVDA